MPTLTLGPNGPTPNPLTVQQNDRQINIVNGLGQAVVLELDPAGFLNPSSGASLTVPVAGWNGTVGANGGSYSYIDPTSEKKAPRNGRIDVS
jgi:hypothetical protein